MRLASVKKYVKKKILYYIQMYVIFLGFQQYIQKIFFVNKIRNATLMSTNK